MHRLVAVVLTALWTTILFAGELFPVRYFSPGGQATSMVLGDIDGDGDVDAVWSAGLFDSRVVAVSRQTAVGLFEDSGSFTGLRDARVLVSADLTNDGFDDFVIVDRDDSSIHILYGDAQQPRMEATGLFVLTSSGEAADFNEDGWLDILLGSRVFLSDQGTSFGEVDPISPVGATAVADFDGDGHVDIVAQTTSLNLFLGAGDGSFEEPELFPLDSAVGELAVVDLNRDGRPDIVKTNPAIDSVSVFLNEQGRFDDEVIVPTGPDPSEPVVGDFNGDGNPDVAIKTDGEVAPFLGDGSGNIVPGDPVFERISFLAGSADLDRDGIGDLVAYSRLPNTIGVWFGDQGDALAGPVYLDVGFANRGPFIGDFDGDGDLDLVAALRDIQRRKWIYKARLNEGSFTFSPIVESESAANLSTGNARVADVDGDGRDDVLLTEFIGWPLALLSNGDGTFEERRLPFGGFQYVGLVTADFDQDGDVDFAAVDLIFRRIFVYLGDGNGDFAPPTFFVVDIPTVSGITIVSGLLDGDSFPDLAVRLRGGIGIYLGRGDGTFEEGTVVPGFGAAMTIGDANGDGLADLITGRGGIEVWPGNGDGTFGDWIATGTGDPVVRLETADLNNDGILDVALNNFRSTPLTRFPSYMLGNGDGTFSRAFRFFAWGESENNRDNQAADMDGDGRTDLVVMEGGRTGVAILPNRGPFSNEPPVADAGPDVTAECASATTTAVELDGSASYDPDDDPLSFGWSSPGISFDPADAAQTTGVFPLGLATATLTVSDGVAEDSDEAVVEIVDTTPPEGRITGPAELACLGPGDVPVVVEDDFADTCDAEPNRSYEPAPGPTYDTHGDWEVVLTVTDDSRNRGAADVRFTIDLVPPSASIVVPDSRLLAPSSLPLSVVVIASDDDEAAGDVVKERLYIDVCLVLDGDQDGDRDGLLHDETLDIGPELLCRLVSRCGVTELADPVLRLEAEDCGGNVGVDELTLNGGLRLVPGICP